MIVENGRRNRVKVTHWAHNSKMGVQFLLSLIIEREDVAEWVCSLL